MRAVLHKDRIRAWLLMICFLAGSFHASIAQPKGVGLDEWFPRLRFGMWVEVEGKQTPDGILEASEIKIYYGELDEVEVESYVESVDLARMTFQMAVGVRVVATQDTEMEGPEGHRHATLAFLEAGDRVEVSGQLQKEGSLLAEEIEIDESKRLEPDFPRKNEHELTATIESIDAAEHRIVVLGLPVQLSERTRYKSSLPD